MGVVLGLWDLIVPLYEDLSWIIPHIICHKQIIIHGDILSKGKGIHDKKFVGIWSTMIISIKNNDGGSILYFIGSSGNLVTLH